MPSHFVLVINLLCVVNLVWSQPGDPPMHAEYYLERLASAKDSQFEEIMESFADYLETHPDDVEVRIERCKFLGEAYYDYYEEYNPKYLEFEDCLDQLLIDFPQSKPVLSYKLEHVYGDSAIAFCTRVLQDSAFSIFDPQFLGQMHQALAEAYELQGETQKVIAHAEMASKANDSLDVSLLLARQYVELNNYDQARQLLRSHLDSTDAPWMLQQKGELLLELGQVEEALFALENAMADTSLWFDHANLAEALVRADRPEEARPFLLEALRDGYDQAPALHRLLSFDFKHSPSDTTLATYRALNDNDFFNDAFGFYRFRMMFRTPFSGWSFFDLGKLLLVVLVIVFIVCVPYLWILPIHYLSARFKSGIGLTSLPQARWSLRDFWWISSGFIFVEFIAWALFNYQHLILFMFDDYYNEEISGISQNQADMALFFSAGILVLIGLFVKKADMQYLKPREWSLGMSLLLGIGICFLLRVVYFTIVAWDVLSAQIMVTYGSVMDSVGSINSYYHPILGFLLVVIIVPLYEEYLFRGIILSAVEKKSNFWLANCLQALIFALVHEDAAHFIFYLSFGLLAGYFVKRSGSILPSLIFHMTNNAFAFIAMVRLL